jgi:hypothetical protein
MNNQIVSLLAQFSVYLGEICLPGQNHRKLTDGGEGLYDIFEQFQSLRT